MDDAWTWGTSVTAVHQHHARPPALAPWVGARWPRRLDERCCRRRHEIFEACGVARKTRPLRAHECRCGGRVQTQNYDICGGFISGSPRSPTLPGLAHEGSPPHSRRSPCHGTTEPYYHRSESTRISRLKVTGAIFHTVSHRPLHPLWRNDSTLDSWDHSPGPGLPIEDAAISPL